MPKTAKKRAARKPTTKPKRRAAKPARRPAAKSAQSKSAAPRASRKPAANVILGTTEQGDGDWQLPRLEQRLDQLRRMITLRHRHRPGRVVWTNQPHGRRVVEVDAKAEGSVGAADGMVTNDSGVLLTVRTADCVPIYLVADRAVGLLHAGMTGTVEGILPRGVRAMRRYFGVRPERLTVRFGPHICRSCYRLSEENDKYLRQHPEANPYITPRGHHRYFALIDMLSDQAAELGVQRLQADNRCTYHSAGLFSSRRGHGDQRQLSYIMLGAPVKPTKPAPKPAAKSSRSRA